jgi:hypothetical protein
MNDPEKTIPFRPSPAEIAYLRSLLKRIKTFDTIHDDDAEEVIAKINGWNSDPESIPPGSTKENNSLGDSG